MTDPAASRGSSSIALGAEDRVRRCATVSLSVAAGDWGYARRQATGIDTHWASRSRESPAMFNGVIHLMREVVHEQNAFLGVFLQTDFKSYLHWREHGFPEAGVRDGFGSALIRSAEGHVILDRQRAGNLNSGLAYLPGGFIDPRDVTADGSIDIDGSILRELAEETGLLPAELDMQPGYILIVHGPLVSMVRELRSRLDAAALRERILAHIAADPHAELSDAVIVRTPADIADVALAPYARQLLAWLHAQPDA